MPLEQTVFVVDDDPGARDSVCCLVRSMGIAAEPFASAEDFLQHYAAGRPGCLVTDVRMLGMSGIELQETLSQRGIALPVIVLTAYARTRLTVRAMNAGAVTLLEKPYDEDELWDAIRQALARDAQQHTAQAQKQDMLDRLKTLSAGELEVFKLVVQGDLNKTIARKLGLSIRAVEKRRAIVFEKMQADSLAVLVRMAIDTQLPL